MKEPVMADPIESRFARIESDIQHIRADVADVRVELRRTNDRIDVLATKVDNNHGELNKKIDDVNEKLSNKIDGVHHSLKDKLHSMTVWALLLYVTLAGGMLTIIGRAFKWI
jgi:chromosome segregation ATPase